MKVSNGKRNRQSSVDFYALRTSTGCLNGSVSSLLLVRSLVSRHC
jgi:hypothetical protein